MENLIYSFNSVVPLFVLVVIGYLLRRKNVIQDSFVSTGTKIGFQVALPVLLFQQVSQADLTTVFNPRLILFAVASILLTVLLLTAVIPLFVKGNPQRGAMIQGIYRGNFAILGVPLAINMFGETGAAPTSLLLPFTIPLYNILAVVILVLFEPKDGPKNQVDMGKILKGILTNPLIIGILLALPFAIFKIQLPEMVDRSLDSISSLTTPLALICLGGQFQFQSAKENLGLTLTATLLKQIFLPAAGAVRGRYGWAFARESWGPSLPVMAPSAVSSYIMAKNMRSDDQLAAQILMMTTLVSPFTICLGIYLLRSMGLL